MNHSRNRFEYDLPTAVTFLFAGLGLGWVLALLVSPLSENSSSRPRLASKPSSVVDEVLFG